MSLLPYVELGVNRKNNTCRQKESLETIHLINFIPSSGS